ncbi:LysR family transcriptional regulator [Sorangium sp. So ce1036]|uniref:LysR family transcriptional regulator n=1 Tax=Sorangium sp. So ce1036 TaxID=3133328 RepID=UPI003F058A1E
MLINYELLRTLLEAGTGPTFTEAARRRRVTPSAVSHQIKALEAQLGVPLFERVGRSARLLPAAEGLVLALRDAFARIDDALAAVSDDHHAVRGVVRIGGPGPFSRMWLRPRLARLLRAHPELVVDVRFDVPSVLTRRLLAGDDDLGILVSAPGDPALEARPIYVEEFSAVASPAYLKAHGRPETARELAAHRFVVFDEDLAMHAAWWRAAFGKKEPLPPRIACRIRSLDEMLALAAAGVGIAVLPDYFIADAVAAGEVAVVRPRPGKGRRGARNTIHLAWRKGATQSARFRAVQAALLDEAR